MDDHRADLIRAAIRGWNNLTMGDAADAAVDAAFSNFPGSWEAWGRVVDQVLQAADCRPAPAVSLSECAVVPAEAFPEMLGAFWRVKNGFHYADEPPPTDTSDYAAYRAMLAAVPQLPIEMSEREKRIREAMRRPAPGITLSFPQDINILLERLDVVSNLLAIRNMNLAQAAHTIKELAVVRDALDQYDAETAGVPLGEEDFQRGRSTYNWRRSIVREIRALIDRLKLPASKNVSPAA